MGPDMHAKKRKAPADAAPAYKKRTPAKKFVPKSIKKVEAPAVASPAPAATKKAAGRKTAAEMMSDDDKSDDEEAGAWDAVNEDGTKKKGKQTTLPPKNKAKAKAKEAARAAAKKAGPAAKVPEPDVDEDAKKKSKKAEKKADASDSESESEAEVVEGDDSEDEEDQAATLLKGFESSDEEEDFHDVTVDGKAIAKSAIPDEKKTKKKLKAAAKKAPEKVVPGVIYLGRVPHGFYEHEMRSYFTQFGNVTRLRLSRNKTTGKSKHYAFLEFDDGDVAQIVADTMNNYLLFGHILKCKVVPRDNLEYIEKLFKGANKRYKPRPVSKLAKAELEKKRTEETWQKMVKKENTKRKSITKRLAEKGIDYEFEAPVAKKAKTEDEVKAIEPEVVAAVPAPAAIEDSAEDTITVASVVPKEKAPAKKTKAKKAKKAKA